MLDVINLSKYYKTHKAVEDVSFSAKKGRITVLAGVNGSGKSTIIKCICGIHYPTKGKIIIRTSNGEKTDVENSPEKARKLIGYVPEIPVLPESSRVSDLLSYGANLFGIKDYSEIIEKCSLADVLKMHISDLSKGYKQRTSIAFALLKNPEIIVLDEPVTGLDPKQIFEMRKLIKEESKNRTIIISTHILSEIHELSPDIIILNKGKIVETGSEKDIVLRNNAPDFEKAFLKVTQQ